MPKAWQYLANSIVEKERRRKDAERFATSERLKLANEWADRQREEMNQTLAKYNRALPDSGDFAPARAARPGVPTEYGWTERPGKVDPLQALWQTLPPDLQRVAQHQAGLSGEALGELQVPGQLVAESAVGPALRGETRAAAASPGGLVESLLRGAGTLAGEAVSGGLPQAVAGASQRWAETPEPFPGVKGAAEVVLDPLNLAGLGEARAVGRGLRGLAERAMPAAKAAGRVAREVATSPELARAVPALSVEDVGKAGEGLVDPGYKARIAEWDNKTLATEKQYLQIDMRLIREQIEKAPPASIGLHEQQMAKRQAKIQAVEQEQAARAAGTTPRARRAREEVQRTGVLTITPDESESLLRDVRDRYRETHSPKEDKGIDARGELRVGYAYNPDAFIISDLSGRPLRHYVQLPDGRLAHPDEITEAIRRGRVRIAGQEARKGVYTPVAVGEAALRQPAQTEWSPAIQQALDDWNGGRAYVDGAGNYHLRPEGKRTGSGPVAPWNREAKKAFADAEELHRAANPEQPTAGAPRPGQMRLLSAPEVTGTVGGGAGGYATAPEGATPEERLQRAAAGAAGGLMLGRAARVGARRAGPGLTVEEVSELDDFTRWERRYTDAEDRLREVSERLGQIAQEKSVSGADIGLVRPRGLFAGWTDDEVMAFARQEGRNPMQPDWTDALDPVALKDARSSRRGGGRASKFGAEAKTLQSEARRLKTEVKLAREQMGRALEGKPLIEVPETVEQAEAVGAGTPPPPKATAVGVDMAPLPERQGFAGNIRLEKYPEEVRDQIQAYVNAHPEAVQQARRGVRSDEQVMADARELVESVGGDFRKLQKKWQPGQAWNAEEVQALRGVLRTRTEDVVQAQRAARAQGSTENLLRLRYALEQHAAVQQSLHGVTAEAGRALRAFRRPVEEALGSQDAVKMERLLRQLGGPEAAKQAAAALAKVDVNDVDAVAAFARSVVKPNLQDYITELYYNSILSGPTTHIVNAVSNATQVLLDPLERAAAAATEVPLAAAQRRGRERYLGEAGRSLYGARLGLADATKAFAYTMQHGFTAGAATKFEFRPKAFKGKFGRLLNTPSTLLEATDQFFGVLNQRAAMHATAYRMAKGDPERVAELLGNPTKELLEQADEMAEYRLFRQESDVANAATQFRNQLGYGGFQPGRFFFPFIRTPWNLLKYGLERSPLGFLNPELYKSLARRDPAAAEQLARAGLGTALAGGVYIAVGEDGITGAAPTNAAERDRFYREGKQPYSIKIGDRWVSFQRLEPLNQTLNLLAAAVEAGRANDKTAEEKLSQLGATIGKNLTSQTFMRGINDLLNALSEPERYATQVLERPAAALAVPFSSAMRTATRAVDPTIRRAEGLGEEIRAGVPGASAGLMPRLDAFGEPIERETPALMPYQVGTERSDPLTRELSRLEYNLGFVGDSIQGVRLTREQQQAYQAIAGRATKRVFEALIASEQYRGLDDSAKVEVLDRAVASVRRKARDAVLEQIIRERVREKVAQRQAG